MSNATQGPWMRDGFVIKGKRSETICVMGEIDGFESGYRELPNAVANGRLITAAPELFEACQAVLDKYSKVDGELPFSIRLKLLKAIAKAEGRE